MTDLIFFYGSLLSGFDRPGGARLAQSLVLVGRASLEARLFDLGPYPGAVRAAGCVTWGELHRMLDVGLVLSVLDRFEGYHVSEPDTSLFRREEARVRIVEGGSVLAWTYLCGDPLVRAPVIESGDYVQYLKQKRAAPNASRS